MRITIILFSVVFWSLSLSAQDEMATRPRLDVNFALGIPTAGYADASQDIGLGLDLGLYFPIKTAPWLQIGPQFLYLGTGKEKQYIDQRLEISANGQVIDVIELPMRVETVNSIIGGHLVLRTELGTSTGFIKPYLQGLIGTRRIATDISIYDESENGWFDDEDDKITSSTAQEDWVFSYGGGIGFHIKIGRKTFLNIGANYLVGGNADYYTEDDIENFDITFTGDGSNYNPNDPNISDDDINVNTEPTTSETSILQFNIGLNFIIDKGY